ncbi:MAG: hypothetical protein NVSMB51_02300 [Solirubrobacteraceae bacterium]
MYAVRLADEVRRDCGELAAAARWVRIDERRFAAIDPGAYAPQLDPAIHYLDGDEEGVAMYLLSLDAINFGSGWFPTLAKRPGHSGYATIAQALAEHFRAAGAWTPDELRSMGAPRLAAILGQRADHELIDLFAQSLRALGVHLGESSALALARRAGSADGFARALAEGMAMWDDRGFYKRAQLAAADLALAGLVQWRDLDSLTIFADNVVPHVLRCEGVLHYDARLAALIDSNRLLRRGPQEREIRACAVHACELLAGELQVSPRVLDNWLWNRGQLARFKELPRHRCRTVFY